MAAPHTRRRKTAAEPSLVVPPRNTSARSTSSRKAKKDKTHQPTGTTGMPQQEPRIQAAVAAKPGMFSCTVTAETIDLLTFLGTLGKCRFPEDNGPTTNDEQCDEIVEYPAAKKHMKKRGQSFSITSQK